MGGLGNAFRLFYEEAKYPRRDSKARMSLGDGEGEESPGADAAESPGVARFSRLHRTSKHQ